MERLTERPPFPLTTFKRCQLCGYEDEDICSFRMLVECDDLDEPEFDRVLVVCRKEPGHSCIQWIENHPRLYLEGPWSAVGPGRFMLICGDCKFRSGASCTHKNLKINGGEGLDLQVSRPLGNVRVCFSDGTASTDFGVFTSCSGKDILDG